MNIFDTFGTAVNSLGTNKLRSFLTILGVIIGVSSVILLVSIGAGATQQVISRIQSLGANLIFVSPVQRNGGSFTMSDVAYVQKNVPMATQVLPDVQSSGNVAFGNNSQGASIEGITPGYLHARNDTTSLGTTPTAFQVSSHAKVVDLGATLAQQLFPSQNPIGQSVFVSGQSFRVIGVMKSQGGGFGQNLDGTVFIPITTAQDLTGSDQVSTLLVQTASAQDASAAQGMITRLYMQKFGSDQAIRVQSQDQILSTVNQTQATLTELLGGIAAIALLVGGIGIMNIMLVSVTERTREIGIRKAVGAANDDILSQFLLEALLLSMSGGGIGVAVALALDKVVGQLLSITPQVSAPSIALALIFSAVVGVIFGFYPALKASRTYPVEALRSE